MKRLILGVLTAGLLLGSLARTADAGAVPFFPFLFPPIAGCGTVGIVESFYDFDGDGYLDECLVWFADKGGAFLVAGLENFSVGDRVFVTGLNCTTCLTTCPAGAILFGNVTAGCP